MRNLASLIVLLGLLLIGPASSLAHEGEGPSIDVAGGQIRHGEPFRILGDEFGYNDTAVIEISSSAGDVFPLGVVMTDIEGHFIADVVVPAEMHDGYAELQATTVSGLVASTWVLVGTGPDLNEGLAAAGSADRPPVWADPSVLALVIFLGGATAALLYLLLARPNGSFERRPRIVPRKLK